MPQGANDKARESAMGPACSLLPWSGGYCLGGSLAAFALGKVALALGLLRGREFLARTGHGLGQAGEVMGYLE